MSKLKQENLHLELEVLAKKEKLMRVTNQSSPEVRAPPPVTPVNSASARSTTMTTADMLDQETLLTSLMQEFTPPSKAEKQQLTTPTFPIMRQTKSGDSKSHIYYPKCTLDYEKLDISEFVFAFVDFIQQQSRHYAAISSTFN